MLIIFAVHVYVSRCHVHELIIIKCKIHIVHVHVHVYVITNYCTVHDNMGLFVHLLHF